MTWKASGAGCPRVGIVGMGYVGLPLALQFARAGCPVTGFDVDREKVDAIGAGRSYIRYIADGDIGELVSSGLLRATTDYAAVSEVDAVVLCLPTPLNQHRAPDLSYVLGTGADIAPHLRAGQLVSLESTTYPGTTDEELRPVLEEGSGLKAGVDFHLVYSPEREDPGNPDYSTGNIPKLIGGLTPECLQAGVELYRLAVAAVVPVSHTRVAEAAKIVENVFRSVNIAMVNELKVVFDRMGIDVWEVIEAAKTKPFGFMPFYPGPGLGGHCLLPEERLFVREDLDVQVLAAEELWAQATATNQARCVGGTDVVEPDGLEVAALEGDAGAWDAVHALGRRRYRGFAMHVRTRDGRSVRVTADHRMLVFQEAGLCVRPASEIAVGDRVAIWRGHERWDALLNPRVDLLADVSWAAGRNVGVRLAVGDWRAWRAEIRRELGASRAGEVVRSGRLPLDVLMSLERRGAIELPHEDMLLCTGRGPSARQFPAVVEVTPDIARLVGYYVSEGCMTGERTVFSFHRLEHEAKADVTKILGSLGVGVAVHELRSCATTHLRVSGLPFAVLMRDLLGCGSGSYDARIPGMLLGASAKHRRELLSGLLRGDGSVDTAEVSYFSVSEDLAAEVEYLFLSLGYVPTVHRRKTQAGVNLRIRATQDLGRLAELFCDTKRERLLDHLQGARRPPRASRAYSRHGEMHLVEVSSVISEPYEGFVYSLETRPSHTFATSHGIVVANCIPLDPFYLTWKAREYEIDTRFIELAGEINTSMPRYVITRLMEALSDRGKPLKESRVLVLGLAYKPNVDDPRESPSFELWELLERRGAKVSYHDPHIPVAPSMRKYPRYEGAQSVPLTPETLTGVDAVLVATAHDDVDYDLVVRHAPLVVDTRNACARVPAELRRGKVVKA